jgi:transcriptional regulator with XRE-family HTH domain
MKKVEFKKIPNNLRKYRKALGLMQGDVAKIMNLKSASIISRWEKGVCFPSMLNAFKLAGLYCVLVDALFFPLIRMIKKKIMERQGDFLSHRHA